jgi:hypothetical protein
MLTIGICSPNRIIAADYLDAFEKSCAHQFALRDPITDETHDVRAGV